MPQQDDLKTQAYAIGERLALLLAAADMSDEAKAGIAAMIPAMSPEQLDRLAKTLEDNVRDGTTKLTANLDQAVAQAQAQYKDSRQAAQRQTLADLDEIERSLPQKP